MLPISRISLISQVSGTLKTALNESICDLLGSHFSIVVSVNFVECILQILIREQSKLVNCSTNKLFKVDSPISISVNMLKSGLSHLANIHRHDTLVLEFLIQLLGFFERNVAISIDVCINELLSPILKMLLFDCMTCQEGDHVTLECVSFFKCAHVVENLVFFSLRDYCLSLHRSNPFVTQKLPC